MTELTRQLGNELKITMLLSGDGFFAYFVSFKFRLWGRVSIHNLLTFMEYINVPPFPPGPHGGLLLRTELRFISSLYIP